MAYMNRSAEAVLYAMRHIKDELAHEIEGADLENFDINNDIICEKVGKICLEFNDAALDIDVEYNSKAFDVRTRFTVELEKIGYHSFPEDAEEGTSLKAQWLMQVCAEFSRGRALRPETLDALKYHLSVE